MATFWVKLYPGQGSGIKQKIWIDIKLVLLHTDWPHKFHNRPACCICRAGKSITHMLRQMMLRLQSWQVRYYTHAAADDAASAELASPLHTCCSRSIIRPCTVFSSLLFKISTLCLCMSAACAVSSVIFSQSFHVHPVYCSQGRVVTHRHWERHDADMLTSYQQHCRYAVNDMS